MEGAEWCGGWGGLEVVSSQDANSSKAFLGGFEMVEIRLALWLVLGGSFFDC